MAPVGLVTSAAPEAQAHIYVPYLSGTVGKQVHYLTSRYRPSFDIRERAHVDQRLVHFTLCIRVPATDKAWLDQTNINRVVLWPFWQPPLPLLPHASPSFPLTPPIPRPPS